MINDIARQRFAEANGWRYTRRGFTLDALIKGQYSGGKSDGAWLHDLARERGRDGGYGCPLPFDHRESFRLPGSGGQRRAVAIMAHNYPDWDTDRTRWLVADLDGALMLHEPPEGLAASWYLPGGTLPQCITRPGHAVVWPTADEMAEFAAAYRCEVESRHWRKQYGDARVAGASVYDSTLRADLADLY